MSTEIEAATDAGTGAVEQQVLQRLTEMVSSTRDAVSRIAAACTSSLATAEPERSDLAVVEGLVLEVLDEDHDLRHGGGFVAAPGLLADAPWWLEWFAWENGRVQRLVTDTDPAGAHFFDYTLMPWYAGPAGARTGAPGRTIAGPYVDYLCTDDYTMTFTEAVWRDVDGVSTFAGVAGVDVRVMAVEAMFLPVLRASNRHLVVLNRFGRVVVSNTARWLSGDLCDEVDAAAGFAGADPRVRVVADSELAMVDLGVR